MQYDHKPIGKSRVAKWGNSLAVRLPKILAESHGLAEGDELEITTGQEGLTLKKKPGPGLDDLVNAITDENRHAEIDFGEPQGNEAW